MMAQQQSAPRASLEVPRSEGVTPGNMTPNQSRRGSISMTPGAVSVGMVAGLPPLSNDESLRREKEKAEARTTYDHLPTPPRPVTCNGTDYFFYLDIAASRGPSPN